MRHLSNTGFSPRSNASCSSRTWLVCPEALKRPSSLSPCSSMKDTHCSTSTGTSRWEPHWASYNIVSSRCCPKTPAAMQHRQKTLTSSLMANNIYVYQRGLGPLFNAFIINFTKLHENLTSSEWSPYDSAYGSDPFLHVTLRVGHQQEWFMTYSCSILLSAPPWNQS